MRPIMADGLKVPVTLSIGVAQWQAGESARQLLISADEALYASKLAGRNRVTLASPCPLAGADT